MNAITWPRRRDMYLTVNKKGSKNEPTILLVIGTWLVATVADPALAERTE